MSHTVSSQISEKVPAILAEINKARSILLCCHPSPDPDSVCSNLAMKAVLEQLGKKATVIKGDSDIPEAFMHFPGARNIMMKSFWEIDPNEFNLIFLIDSSLTGVSRTKPVELPEAMTVINIDHHRTNAGAGSINIVDPTYPATAQLLLDIFKEMKVTITKDIAANLFMGIYTDTGGFKYEGTTSATFDIASELVEICPNYGDLIADMENSNTLSDIAFQGLALSSVRTFCDGKVAFSVIPYSAIQEKNIPDVSISAGMISSMLRTIGGMKITGALIEARPNEIKLSFRGSKNGACDVSKLAVALGGGGHRMAAGAGLKMPLDEAVKLVVEKIKELYNL